MTVSHILTLTPRLLKPNKAACLFSTSAAGSKDVRHVTVIGAGLMGSGIAQVSAQANYKVTMVDTTEGALEKGKSMIALSLKRVARKKFGEDDEAQQKAYIDQVVANITTSTDSAEAVASTDLVIEAIVENMEVKQRLFQSLDKIAPPDTIFATNTSSLPVSTIADAITERRKQQFAGLHFFNPVPAMKLVEVVRTDTVADEVFKTLVEFAKNTGKTPVECKDTPG